MKSTCFLTSLAACLHLFFPTLSSGQTRTFYGVLDADIRVLRLVVKVDEDGAANLTSLDEGNRVFPLEPFQLNAKRLMFDLKATGAKYLSEFDSSAKVYRGTWKQGGREIPLVFKSVVQSPPDVTSEIWEGELNILGKKMTLRFRVYDRKKHAVLLDSPDQQAGGFTGEIERTQEKTIFRIPALKGKFEGRNSADKLSMKGTWNQGLSLPLELKRIKTADIKTTKPAPKRPQTPKPPFPYESIDVSIENKKDQLTLAATLTLPDKPRRVPCAILISGSGAQDRDESIMGHKPFWVLADHLTRHGIATLRFDDRGTAQSTGDHSTATSVDFANDVSAIVDFLKLHPRIDTSQIGLCGHSEGGLIAPLVATQRNDIGFIVMLAGPGVNGEKILRSQIKLVLAAAGVSDQEIAVSVFLQDRLLKLATSAEQAGDKQVEQLVDELIGKFPSTATDRDQIMTNARAGFQRLSTPWMKFFLKYEPGPTLAKVNCPLLVLNGSKDTQVDPGLNLSAIRKALESGGKNNFKIKQLDGLNHLFQSCQTGSINEYETLEETISPQALKDISSWIGSLSAK